MEYGNIITIDHLELFFVQYIDENNITLISNQNPQEKLHYHFEDDYIKQNKFIVVYKSLKKGVCELNEIYENKIIYLRQNIDGLIKERRGVVQKQTNDKIEVFFNHENNQPTEIIDFNYKGIPKHILNIKVEEPLYNQNNNVSPNVNVKDKVLYNEEPEHEEEYYFSIEQQVNEMLEDLIHDDKINTKKQMKQMNIMIKRYVELIHKYINIQSDYKLNELSKHPIFDYTIKGNSMFDFVSNHTKVQFYDYEHCNPKLSASEKKELESNSISNDDFYFANDEEIIDLEDNSNIHNLSDLERINETILETLVIENKENDVLYKKKYNCNVLLYDQSNVNSDGKNTIYKLKTKEPIVLDGFVIPNVAKYQESIHNSPMSYLLEQIYAMDYRKEHFRLSNEINNPMTHTICVKKEDESFYSYLNKALPTIENYIKQYIYKNNYFNVYNALRDLSLFRIYDLKKEYFEWIKEHIVSCIEKYESTYKEKVKLYDRPIIVNEESIESDLYPEYLSKDFYSHSELFSLLNQESHYMKLFDLKKKNLSHKVNIRDDGSLTNIIEEIQSNMNKDKPKKHYDKIYNSLDELERSYELPILKDLNSSFQEISMPYEPQEYQSSINILWKQQASWGTTYESKDIFERSILKVFQTDDFTQEPYSSHKSEIMDFYINYKINDNSIAYVIQEKKNYIWNVDKWVLDEEEDEVKRVIREKISKIMEIEQMNQHKEESHYDENHRQIQLQKYQFMKKQKTIQSLKYDKFKKSLMQKDTREIIESPRRELLDKIMNMTNLNDKMKNIQLFCELYCIEGQDPYWFYCLQTNTKLIPKFLNTLALSHEKGTYHQTLDKICLEQGKEEGHHYIDKHSGYVIKNINFYEEEGFTSEGFKIKTRESIQEETKIETTHDPKNMKGNIFNILNTIGTEYENIELVKQQLDQIIKKYKIKDDYDIMCMMYALIYLHIKVYDEKVSIIKKAFYNCITTFKGYPMGDSLDGIKYMICIFNHYIKHNDTFKDKRKKKYESETFKENIDKILNVLPDLKHDVKEYNEDKALSQDTESSMYDLFLPRLRQINIMKKEPTSYEKKFIIQKYIHDFANIQEPLLNHISGYKSINSFFYDSEHKGPSALFQTSNKESNLYNIQSHLSSLVELTHFRKCHLSYYKTNTKTDHYAYVYERTNEMYQKYFKYCEKLNISTNIENMDKIDVKEKFDEVYQTKIHFIDEKKENNEKKEQMDENKLNELNENLSKQRSKHAKFDKSIYQQIFRFTKDKKINVLNEQTIEHYYYMSSILWNIIIDILYYLPSKTMEQLNYKDFTQLTCKTWNLDQNHYHDIKDIILNNHFKTIKEKINFDELFGEFRIMVEEMPHIQDNEFKYNLYDNLLFIIFLSCSKQKSFHNELVNYYKIYMSHLDIDHKEINKKSEKDKRTEKKQITDKFRDMHEEEREIEYELKMNKLGDWSVGLDKSIYKYSKDKYISDIEDISQMVMNDETIYEENIHGIEEEEENDMDNYEEYNNYEEEE
jgi:hypothetical protein